MTRDKEHRLSVPRDSERRGSRSNLANIGIHVQERRETRSAVQKQVRSLSVSVCTVPNLEDIHPP